MKLKTSVSGVAVHSYFFLEELARTHKHSTLSARSAGCFRAESTRPFARLRNWGDWEGLFILMELMDRQTLKGNETISGGAALSD